MERVEDTGPVVGELTTAQQQVGVSRESKPPESNPIDPLCPRLFRPTTRSWRRHPRHSCTRLGGSIRASEVWRSRKSSPR
jgi:hypothetical protein